MRHAVIACLVAACGSRTYTGPWRIDPPSTGMVALDQSRVAIEIDLVHSRSYVETGGILGEMLVGSHENEHEGSETQREPLGAIVVDLRTGSCAYHRGRTVTRTTSPQRHALPVPEPAYSHWVGDDGASVVLLDDNHHVVRVLDPSLQWRTIEYQRCHPWPTRPR